MSITASQVFKAFLSQMEHPATSGGLGISFVLGTPDVSRVELSVPSGAIRFLADSPEEHAGQRRRLASVAPAGRQIAAQIFVFNADEPRLLAMVDLLHNIKHSLASIDVNGTSIVVRYGNTESVPYGNDERFLDHVLAVPVTFHWQPE